MGAKNVGPVASGSPVFDYERAFSRNRGLVNEEEQTKLRRSRVAIAGVGGVGGVVASTLARVGVGNFRLADPDRFDIVNFNRQGGAMMSTVGRPKAEAVGDQVRDINPTAQVETYAVGVDKSNVGAFLEGVDLLVDAVDFFKLDARRVLYAACRERRIPVVVSAPLGMSATVHVFVPDGMSFEDYFDLRPGMSQVDELVAFLIGLSPALLHAPYIDMRHTNVAEQYGPSLGPAVMLCAGLLGIESVRILLNRPGLRPAPHYLQIDAYRHRVVSRRLWLGGRSPIQRLKRAIAKRQLIKRVGGLPT